MTDPRPVPNSEDPGVGWLLASGEPAIEYLTLTGILGQSPDEPAPRGAREHFTSGPLVAGLLAPNDVHVYAKWSGAFWRLAALTELGLPPGVPGAEALLRSVLDWLRRMEAAGYPPCPRGVPRAHAVWHGNALAAAVALDWQHGDDVRWLVDRLLEWQWPDGGWNCDRHPVVSCSSVHESLGPLWGLAAYFGMTRDSAVGGALERVVEFFLERRLFRSRRTGDVINPAWLRFRHPAYYHYDVLQALWVLARANVRVDARIDDALELVLASRRRDGRWNANGRWWRPPGAAGPNKEAVDWGPSQPNVMVTVKALTVLATFTNTGPRLTDAQ